METKYYALKDKPLEGFFFFLCEHEEKKQLLKAAILSNVSALRASFLVSNRIARAKKPFTVGEESILPAAKDSFVGKPKLFINRLENFREEAITKHSLMCFMLLCI